MNRKEIISHARYIAGVFTAEAVMVTGKPALVLHGLLEEAEVDNCLYIHLPGIMHQVVRQCPSTLPVDAETLYPVSFKQNHLHSLLFLEMDVDLRIGHSFSMVSSKVWAECPLKIIQRNNPDIHHAIIDLLQVDNTE